MIVSKVEGCPEAAGVWALEAKNYYRSSKEHNGNVLITRPQSQRFHVLEQIQFKADVESRLSDQPTTNHCRSINIDVRNAWASLVATSFL